MDAVAVDLYNQVITGEIACTLTEAVGAANHTGPKVLLFANNRREADNHEIEDGTSPTVTAKYGTGGLNTPIILDISAGTTRKNNDNIAQTLRARMGTGGGNVPIVIEEKNKRKQYILRRLTPLECCRLQGFPDWWVDGAEGSDSAIYKMWGNGIALPCAADVIGRLAKELDTSTP